MNIEEQKDGDKFATYVYLKQILVNKLYQSFFIYNVFFQFILSFPVFTSLNHIKKT